MKIALNGFGRIGRTVFRQVLTDHPDIEVVLINDIAPLETCAYLFEFDSVFGRWPGAVSQTASQLIVDGRRVRYSSVPSVADTDLAGVDVLLDCTGVVRNRDIAESGLRAGAGSVLVSGPCAAADTTVVLGANDGALGDARIISNASCTTNAVAPLLRVLDDAAGIAQGHWTTIHCYTSSQPMMDAPGPSAARSRAGAMSIVPTTTSATHQVDLVLPAISDRVSGAAVRVPVPSVSAVDFVLTFRRDVSVDEILETAAKSPVIGQTDRPLVSSDLRARPESLVLATPETRNIGNRQVRLFGWYDNEWGFSARMIDMARRMCARGRSGVG